MEEWVNFTACTYKISSAKHEFCNNKPNPLLALMQWEIGTHLAQREIQLHCIYPLCSNAQGKFYWYNEWQIIQSFTKQQQLTSKNLAGIHNVTATYLHSLLSCNKVVNMPTTEIPQCTFPYFGWIHNRHQKVTFAYANLTWFEILAEHLPGWK